MRLWEIAAVLLVLLALVGVPVAVFAYQFMYLPARHPDVITVTMRTPEHGNVYPRVIHVKKGDLVRLRITSEDVPHGFRIKEFDVKVFPVSAGKFKMVEFVAEEAGIFKFVCNNRCSPRHTEVNGQFIVDD